MNKTQAYMLLASSCGAVIGSAATYLLVHKRLSTKFEEITQDEIEQVKETYKRLYKDEEYSTPTEAAEAFGIEETQTAEKVIQEQGYSIDEVTEAFHSRDFEAEEQERARNALQATLDAAKARRAATESGGVSYPPEHDPEVVDKTRPHMITVDDFHLSDGGEFEKLSIVYFEGDKTLVDDRDEPIDDIENLVTEDILSKFGEKSNDPDVVYVRNPRISTDFEITRDKRDYAEVILGIRGLPQTRNIFDDQEKEPIRRMRDDG